MSEEEEDLENLKETIGCLHVFMFFFMVVDTILVAAFMLWTTKPVLFALIVSMILTLTMLVLSLFGVKVYNKKIQDLDGHDS